MKEILSNYNVWLTVLAIGCIVAERVRPWRRAQPVRRPELWQDMFWLIFNGYLFAIVFAVPTDGMERAMASGFAALAGTPPTELQLINGYPLAAQLGIVLVAGDFIEWLVHNLLHRWGPLWRIHRVHHSIVDMDWIGNFRFHWAEILVYKTIKYIPLAMLGARWEAILIGAVISTMIGNLNHANLNISWGPLRYVLNSPRMHIWHHDKRPDKPAGVNFGVVFSMWDWIFGTAYMPRDAREPDALGYRGMERVPASLLMRFFLPFMNQKPEART